MNRENNNDAYKSMKTGTKTGFKISIIAIIFGMIGIIITFLMNALFAGIEFLNYLIIMTSIVTGYCVGKKLYQFKEDK
jgi:hypothetical protein